MNRRPARAIVIIAFVAILAMIAAACGESATDMVNDALTETPSAPQASGDTGRETPTAAPTATPAPTATEEPEPTPTPAPQALNVIAKGFGQGEYGSLGFGFIVENPNPGLAVEDSRYQVAVYDANGTVIGTDSSYITVLFPGQKLGIAGQVFLPDGATAASIDVQVKPGQYEPFDPVPTFTTENVQYVGDQYFPKVTGIVKSPYQKDLEHIRVSAIAYDANGAIIGGGFTFLDFVPAGGQAAAEVSVTTTGAPASVEMYPSISGLTLLTQ